MKEILEDIKREFKVDRSDWKPVKFGQVAIQKKESVDRDNTDLTWYVKGEHMESEDLHIRQWGELADEYLGPAFIRKFNKEDILYGSRRTYLRKVAIAHFDGITSNTTFVVNANEKLILKELLPFVMLSEGFAKHSIKNSKGSVNPYINWKDIANHEFLLPPKDQQAHLAELLWAADESLEDMTKTRTTLQNLKQAKLREVFNRQSCRKIRISDLSESLDNKRVPITRSQRTGGDIPYYGASGIVDYVKDFIFDEPILLISEDGENLVSRKLPIAYEVDHQCWVNNHAHVLRINSESRYLVSEYLNNHDISDFITGGTRPKLTKGILSDMPIFLPQKVECEAAEKSLKNIDSAFSTVNNHIRDSKQLQKSLINRIF